MNHKSNSISGTVHWPNILFQWKIKMLPLKIVPLWQKTVWKKFPKNTAAWRGQREPFRYIPDHERPWQWSSYTTRSCLPWGSICRLSFSCPEWEKQKSCGPEDSVLDFRWKQTGIHLTLKPFWRHCRVCRKAEFWVHQPCHPPRRQNLKMLQFRICSLGF